MTPNSAQTCREGRKDDAVVARRLPPEGEVGDQGESQANIDKEEM